MRVINALISLNIHAINKKVPVPVPDPAGFFFLIPVPVRFRPELKYWFWCIPNLKWENSKCTIHMNNWCRCNPSRSLKVRVLAHRGFFYQTNWKNWVNWYKNTDLKWWKGRRWYPSILFQGNIQFQILPNTPHTVIFGPQFEKKISIN